MLRKTARFESQNVLDFLIETLITEMNTINTMISFEELQIAYTWLKIRLGSRLENSAVIVCAPPYVRRPLLRPTPRVL